MSRRYPVLRCSCSNRGCMEPANHWLKLAEKTFVPVCTGCKRAVKAVLDLAKKPK